MSSLVIADFGTNYSGIGWLTLVLPLLLLIIVVAWWRLAWHRSSTDSAEIAETPAAQTSGDPGPGPGVRDIAPAVVPLVPGAVLLPLGFAIALTVAVIAFWWWHAMRRAQG
jgi:hypothetical protein